MSDHGRIDDGYGEQMSAEQVLALYEQRAQVIAREWATPAAPKEDLAQEARIALWKETQKRPGDRMQGLASVVIRRAVSHAALDQRWTGTDYKKGGQPRDPIRTNPSGLPEDQVGDSDGPAPIWLVAADLLDGVEYAYHEGQIMQALNALPPEHREYVFMRFWMGYNEPEIAAYTGRTKANVNRTWHQVIRPRLQEHLANLVGAW